MPFIFLGLLIMIAGGYFFFFARKKGKTEMAFGSLGLFFAGMLLILVFLVFLVTNSL